MRTFYSIVVTVVLSSSIIYSQDSRWVLVGESETYTLYYDTQTTKHNYEYNTYEVWIKDVARYPKVENDGSILDYILTQWKLYCKSGKVQVLRMLAYFNDGLTQRINVPGDIHEYAPESNEEIIMLTICK